MGTPRSDLGRGKNGPSSNEEKLVASSDSVYSQDCYGILKQDYGTKANWGVATK